MTMFTSGRRGPAVTCIEQGHVTPITAVDHLSLRQPSVGKPNDATRLLQQQLQVE